MNRRESIRTMAMTAGAIVALPAWAKEWSREEVVIATSVFDQPQQQMLASIADTIIPPGNSIGALSVGVDKFLDKLISDCYEKDVQDNVKLQIQKLDKSATDSFGKAYSLCSQAERQQLFLKFSNSSVKEEADFFKLIKSETIRGFTTSREVMMNYLSYKPVPGHFYGCVDVKS